MPHADEYLHTHHCHSSHLILKRWRQVAKAARLSVEILHTTPSGFPVVLLKTKRQQPGGLYISAGVHGDEPAPVAALIDWAESNIPLLREANATIIPLFNPHGLAMNTRTDGDGVDLNRMFHNDDHPHIGPWRKAMAGQQFSFGMMLHEDYDAQGMYGYELAGSTPLTVDSFLQKSDPFLARDRRSKIDGFRARNGVIRRVKKPKTLPGLPEALVVYRENAPATFTFESPSEHSLKARIDAHKAIVDEAFRRFGCGT